MALQFDEDATLYEKRLYHKMQHLLRSEEGSSVKATTSMSSSTVGVNVKPPTESKTEEGLTTNSEKSSKIDSTEKENSNQDNDGVVVKSILENAADTSEKTTTKNDRKEMTPPVTWMLRGDPVGRRLLYRLESLTYRLNDLNFQHEELLQQRNILDFDARRTYDWYRQQGPLSGETWPYANEALVHDSITQRELNAYHDLSRAIFDIEDDIHYLDRERQRLLSLLDRRADYNYDYESFPEYEHYLRTHRHDRTSHHYEDIHRPYHSYYGRYGGSYHDDLELHHPRHHVSNYVQLGTKRGDYLFDTKYTTSRLRKQGIPPYHYRYHTHRRRALASRNTEDVYNGSLQKDTDLKYWRSMRLHEMAKRVEQRATGYMYPAELAQDSRARLLWEHAREEARIGQGKIKALNQDSRDARKEFIKNQNRVANLHSRNFLLSQAQLELEEEKALEMQAYSDEATLKAQRELTRAQTQAELAYTT
eukprot:g270.t1